MRAKAYLTLLLFFAVTFSSFSKDIVTFSPDKKLKAVISIIKTPSIKVFSGTEQLFEISGVYMETDKGFIPALNPRIKDTRKKSVNNIIVPLIKERQESIPEKYNETTVEFSGNTALQLRIYNEGIAYRLISNFSGNILVRGDHSEFLFDDHSKLTYQEDTLLNSNYENPYVSKTIKALKKNDKGNLPALITLSSNKKVLLLESSVIDYPCMWIKKNDKNLETYFWNIPSELNVKGNSHTRCYVTKYSDVIAKTNGSREFPWRILAIAEKDIDLLHNQMVYLLAPESRLKETNWIQPGWVTFDWWGRREIYGVDFKAGVNTQTAKYFIDFASKFGIRYFLFDEGWTFREDLTKVVPDLNMSEVMTYAKEKKVDVMLWVPYSLFHEQMEAALNQFQKWGIKGVKIDFMNRSDQEMVNFYWKAAEECAKRHMVIDFHGAFKPDGLRRAYPNVLTREALIEFEYNGGTNWDSPDHHCTLPFIRNIAGPMDYIPGTMFNGTKKSFRTNPDMPMGQGTRAHSMAMAVITESPMQMLPDGPSDYYREEECTHFLTGIPTEWDQIIPLQGEIGDYIALARRKGSTFYLAAITDWTPRQLEICLDFLPENKEFTMELFKDGVNADIRAIDYKKEIVRVRKGETVKISLASGGGYVAKIY